MGSVDSKEENQLLDEQLNVGITVKPSFLARFFISNIVVRSLSYLMAWHKDSDVPVKLKSSASGSLLVAMTGGGKTINETKTGTAGNSWGTAQIFSKIVVGVDIMAFDNSIDIRRSVDGTNFQASFEVVGGTSMYFEADTLKIQVKNTVTDSNGRYQLIGWS